MKLTSDDQKQTTSASVKNERNYEQLPSPSMPQENEIDTDRISEYNLQGDNVVDESLGWFHAKIKVDKSIQWANNYRIQLTMFFLFAAAASIAMILSNKTKASVGLITGSILTILATIAVVYTYLNRVSWRKHPNPLIFYRSICDLCLVIVLLVNEAVECGLSDSCTIEGTPEGCTVSAGFTQFFLFASESWFFVMAIDMQQSLRSPFTDFKKNMRMYHYFVWGSALITSIILVTVDDAAGVSEFGYCWTQRAVNPDDKDKEDGFWDLNTRSWLFFYIWLIIYWIYAIGVMIFAWKRLKEGLAETLRMRLRVLHSVTLYVIAIIIYWGFTFAVYVPYLVLNLQVCARGECEDNQWLIQLMIFMITCKGFFDFVVWFQINELSFSDGLFRSGDDNKKGVDVDVDLNPQVNLALRCEVLYYTTTGIIQAVKDTHHLPREATQQELYLQPQGMGNHGSFVDEDQFSSNTQKRKGTLFIDYCPHTFLMIRRHFGVDTSQYVSSLSKTTKERLSEGASGAFMFFSHDQQLIVKSMSLEEASFLRRIAGDYASYLMRNPDSLLTRFFGCHAIKLYGSTFYFVVMANLFSTEKVIHRRYDIKGSWVNRTAKHPQNGKRVTCRHCNGAYVFGSTDSDAMMCPMRVGKHEPNTILKDNDLTAKVRLDPKEAEELYSQLSRDANFLARLGIMDYSLLMGVHNVEYVVNDISPEKDRSLSKTMVDRNLARSIKSIPTSRPTNYSIQESNRRTTVFDNTSTLESEDSDGLPRRFNGTRKANTVVGPSCYYFGLIDILQTWNFQKRMERYTKIYCLGFDADGLSAVPPTIYKDRFCLKMADIFGIALHNEYDREGENEVQTQSPFTQYM